MSQEIISAHFGQAGIQMGNAFWELACAEHDIKANGEIYETVENTPQSTVFHETPHGQFVPRALLADLEPTVVDEIRVGKFHRLFHPDLLVSGTEDAGNNFARGYYTLGKVFMARLIEKTRLITEGCDNCQGFTVYNSIGGGTGSGVTSLYIDRLRVEYGKKTCINLAICPGKRLSSSTVEPYNSILVTERTLDTTDICFLFGNESLYDICTHNLGLESPTFTDINRVVALMICGFTSSLRFGGSINCSINEIRTNLIPYPRIHFPFMSYAPLSRGDQTEIEQKSPEELAIDLFSDHNRSVKCILDQGKFMTACLIFRGNSSSAALYRSLQAIKKQINLPWVDWCPTGYKFGICNMPPVHTSVMSGSVPPQNGITMLGNHTSMSQTLDNLTTKFDHLYKKRAFVHWYVGEGMEEDEFVEARCTISSVQRDFYEIAGQSDEDYPEPILYTEDDYIAKSKPFCVKYESVYTPSEPFSLSSM